MGEPATYEIYGVKFGQNLQGVRGHYFSGPDGDPHDERMRLDYYVWVLRSADQDVVVDVGFTAETNERRGRDHWENPTVALARLGVDVGAVRHVILSHLHYDHCGDTEPFTNATFVLQERELDFWTGPYATRGAFAPHVEPDDLARILRLDAQGRVHRVDGRYEVTDGVWVDRVGGHTPGMQVTHVRTRRGIVVLASDSSHFFENIEQDKPFAVHADVIEMYQAFDAMTAAATSGLVIAGHDPLIAERFPAVPGHDGRVVRIA